MLLNSKYYSRCAARAGFGTPYPIAVDTNKYYRVYKKLMVATYRSTKLI